MSIQSSVNATIGSLAVFGRMRSTEARQKAMMELDKQKVAINQQRADTESKKLELRQTREARLKDVSPIYAQATLKRAEAAVKKAKNEGYELGTERLKIKQGGLTNEQQ